MKLFENAWNEGDLPRDGIVTIGNFDGVHLGQQALLKRIRERAEAAGRPSVAVTFDPHPLRVVRPDRAPAQLCTRKQKIELLAATGIESLVEIEFSQAFAKTSADAFVDDFLVSRLRAHEVHVGSRFSFGREREGDLDLLVAAGRTRGFAAQGVTEVLHEGEPISSTRIRSAVAAGDVGTAAAMLGRTYSLIGVVGSGDGRGRELGWPTANIGVANELVPADGVYATEARLEGGQTLCASVTNVGVRPTFGGSARRVESHLFDFEGDLYGRELELSFHRRLRGERRFESVEALTSQIALDAAEAREYLAARAC